MLAILGVLTSCGADAVLGVDSRSQSLSVRLGQEVEVTLGNIGPALYESPPASVPTGVVTFIGVDVVPPFNPGGPNQRFRFQAAGPGRAVVTFRRTLNGAVVAIVEDTLVVR